MIEFSFPKEPRRYTNKPFPGYRFVPGKSPHPTRDRQGHSYNKPVEKLSSFNPEDWNSCEIYLYGIDLFNYGYWWEAHEAWEVIWVAAGRHTKTGFFIQGLIQIAAAHLKASQEHHDAASILTLAGLKKLQPLHGYYLGMDVSKFHSDVKANLSAKTVTPVIIELHHPSLKLDR